MRIKIHRGAHEIGGSCVELQSGDTRIVVDLGLPLVEKGDIRFNGGRLNLQTGVELVNSGVLPDIRGLYAWDTERRRIDA
jgi:ribonuclease J